MNNARTAADLEKLADRIRAKLPKDCKIARVLLHGDGLKISNNNYAPYVTFVGRFTKDECSALVGLLVARGVKRVTGHIVTTTISPAFGRAIALLDAAGGDVKAAIAAALAKGDTDAATVLKVRHTEEG